MRNSLIGLYVLLPVIVCQLNCDQRQGNSADLTISLPATVAEYVTPEDLRGLTVVMPVSYDGKEYLFAVDTGSNYIVLGEQFRSRLGTPVSEQKGGWGAFASGGSRTPIKIYRCPDIFLGPFNMAQCGNVTVGDMSTFDSVLGYPIAGIIGMSVLRNFVVEIDVASGVTRILAPKTHIKMPGEAIALQYYQLIPYVEAKFPNNRKIAMLLDTGCNDDGSVAEQYLSLVPSEDAMSRPSDQATLGFANGLEATIKQLQIVKLYVSGRLS